MKNRRYKTRIIIQVFLIVISFLLGGVFMLLLLSFYKVPATDNYVITKDETKVYEKNSLAKSVSKIYNAVYVIQEYESEEINSTGTGFVYKTDDKYGYLLTNEHVIGPGKVVAINNKDEEAPATVLGKDEYLDLAVLRIDKKYVLQVANIGSSEKINIGDTVFTVGSPLGYNYRGSVTSGVLSGKDRMVTTTVSENSNNDWVMRVLQIDASINPGNSGGPLLNVNGDVIGICSMKLLDDGNIEGMGFAIPIEYAMSHVDSFEKGIKIKWPVLGIGMINLTDSAKIQSNNIKVTDKIKEGVAVVSVKSGTGADKAGIKKGDIITKINGNKVKDTAYLRYELYQHQSGETIEVTLYRDGKEKTLKVLLND